MRQFWTLLLLVIIVLAAIGRPALAQEATPQPTPTPLTLFTAYPAQEAALGENVTINLTLRGGRAAQVVRFELDGLPESWTATFRGGGRVIQAAYVQPDQDSQIELRLEPPANPTAGSFGFTVVARGEGETAELPIELTIQEKLPPSLSFEVELPTLRGAPDTTFRYNVTLQNEGDADLTVNLLAETPPGFTVAFKLNNQDVTSIPIAANESKRLSVEAQAFPDLAAGEYAINVLAQGGEVEAATTLAAVVTGQPELSITTPDGRLSAQAYVGDVNTIAVVVENTGSAPAMNVALSGSQPSGWTVEFEPPVIAELPIGEQVEVTANVQPADQAIAGDYMITLRAQPEEGRTESAEFRITVRTSTLWGVVGIALIAIAVAVVGMAVSRFGRR
ncbi:MAG: NEW3 domain-containing protein [Chloroflexota bacterium]